jgi:hypothetical protein
VRSAGGIPRITETERYVDKVLGYYRFFLDQHPVGGRRGSES